MNWEAASVEDLAWWVEPMPETKRGPGRPPHLGPYKPDSRALDVIRRYKNGQTQAQIGAVHKITRERVRQILKKSSLSRLDGGQTIRSFLKTPDMVAKAKAQRDKSDQIKIRAWGIPLEAWREIRTKYGYKPFSAYTKQRDNAKKRGIGFELNFKTWWDIWQESGRWAERGRGKGYCMARFGDSGPYSKDNVYICTIGQNFSDSYITKPARVRRSLTTHCKRGHERTEENAVHSKGKIVDCKPCRTLRDRKRRAKERALV